MEILRIKAHQVMANYRKPMSYNFVDSYPLPPLSTIKGWFHAVVEASEYIPISLSIQGNVSSVVYDLQKMIKFDRIRHDKKKDKMDSRPILEGFNKALTHSPTYVANLFEVDLTLYIRTKKDYLLKFQENLFLFEYPHIGRNEDLARIDSIEVVHLEAIHFGMRSEHEIDYGIYLNREKSKDMGLFGVNYRMPFKYKDPKEKNGIRYFERLDVVYVDNGKPSSGSCLFDKEENRIIDLIGDFSE